MAGYRNPRVWTTGLARQDRGFRELVEFATIEAPPIDMGRITAVNLGALGIQADGTSTFFQLFGPDGREIHSRLVYNPTTALTEYFFDRNVLKARRWLACAGIVLTVATY